MISMNTHAKLAEHVLTLTIEALADCTERQREVYERVHGISQSGDTPTTISTSALAAELDVSKQSVHESLTIARASVYSHIARNLIGHITSLIDEASMPAPGITTLDHSTAGSVMVRYTQRTEQRVNLGVGSQAAESAGKRGLHTEAERSATVQMHQRYAR